MKHLWLGLALLLLLLLLAPRFLAAQTITLGPIAKTAYCVGDTMFVPYMASGNFNSDNVFIAQLSDDNGSFASFVNVGQAKAMQGLIAAFMQNTGNHQRVRVASTSPFSASTDNGSDVSINQVPIPQPTYQRLQDNIVAGLIGDTIQLVDVTPEPQETKFQWVINLDASIHFSSDSSPRVVYSKEGVKTGKLTVTTPSGCSATDSFSLQIASCNPVIPANVHIVTSSSVGEDAAVWVKPGGGFTATGNGPNKTVFVEPGGSVIVRTAGIFYVKQGGSITIPNGQGFISVVAGTGVRVEWTPHMSGVDTFRCADLNFDYSQVNASVNATPIPTITIAQNSNHLRITADQPATTCRIFSLLCTELLSQHGTGTLDVDLASLPAGMYFAIVQVGNERVVRKIVAVH